MNHTLDELKAAARAAETSITPISKATAMGAVAAFRALESIANMPIGRNPQAEAAAMRSIARAALGRTE